MSSCCCWSDANLRGWPAPRGTAEIDTYHLKLKKGFMTQKARWPRVFTGFQNRFPVFLHLFSPPWMEKWIEMEETNYIFLKATELWHSLAMLWCSESNHSHSFWDTWDTGPAPGQHHAKLSLPEPHGLCRWERVYRWLGCDVCGWIRRWVVGQPEAVEPCADNTLKHRQKISKRDILQETIVFRVKSKGSFQCGW